MFKSKFRRITANSLQAVQGFARRLINVVVSLSHIKKVALLQLIIVLLFGFYLAVIGLFGPAKYDLGSATSLLVTPNSTLAKRFQYDNKSQSYTFTNSHSPSSAEQSGISNQVTTKLHTDSSKGVTVSDSAHSANFTLSPTFSTYDGKMADGRIVYPLGDRTGWLVYTVQGTGLKEDLILDHKESDSRTFTYKLGINDSMEARLENDGSVGIYGSSLLSADIAASSPSDQALLQKARQRSKKDQLLFQIPKPYVITENHKKSSVQSVFSLHGDELNLSVTGLDDATYPLSIDPSIYVASAEQFMAGNNETNINFNVADSLIEKGRTTGARFDTWNSTIDLPATSWGSSSVAAGGYVYNLGGTSFSGQIFNTPGSASFVVPAGVTSMTVKTWGGGGGAGGGGAAGSSGGAGGGGGYVTGVITVTPGETLTAYVGGGGGGGNYSAAGNDAGGGGGGGGYSSIYRGSTALFIAAGGGGGGGGRRTIGGAIGNAGGGTSGIAGSSVGVGTGGGGGTSSSGGSGGTGGNNNGSAGASLSGGDGADGRSAQGTDGSGVLGGIATGGNGGLANVNTTRAGGGAGGAGYFGGGGGGNSASSNTDAGNGGGGGSSYIVPGATSTSNTAGSGTSPGNSGDASRSGAGDGAATAAALNNGDTGASGLVSVSFGSGGSGVSKSLSWAKFNTTNGVIDSANPGSGVCSGWCTTSAYDLPSERTNFSLVAYNGYLYALGGTDDSGTRQNTVFIAKLGANGEPQLWHPTDTNKNNWTYWYQDTNLSSVRSDGAAVAYNNRLYLLGGRSTSGPVNTSQYASVNPNGTLGTWTTATNLPYNLYGHSAQVYNDRLYILGGASTVGGTPNSNVYYNKINSDGSLNSWTQTTGFGTPRMSNGGTISVVWGAYIYMSGGCSSVNGSGYCTTVESKTQVASINADGSIDVWNDMAGVSSQRTGAGLISWRDRIYTIGGCSSQNTTTGDCNSGMLSSILYGDVNRDGDASTVGQTNASGTAPCSGGTPTDCNLPGTTYIGNMLTASIVANGYLYVIGGCTNNACSTTSANVSYVAISSTGSITKPATCPSGTYRGSAWCVDTTNTISGGIAAASPVVFNNTLYLVGGLDGSGNINAINRTTLNTDGSIGAWTSQSMTGLGANSVSYLYAYSRANPSSASSVPGNLYIFGGCSTSSSAGCTAYSQNVYKCNILTSGAISACSTSGQLQIGILPGDTATGLGIMSGTVYANYIYLIGGVSPNQVDLKSVRYAEFDNNNNVVTAGSSGWTESPNQMAVGRRRAAAFGYNGYIYVVGGYEAASGVLADIEFIKVNVGDGSLGSASESFTTSSVAINQRWGLSVPVSNSFAYVIGGCTIGASPSGCTTRTDVVQTFQIYNNNSGAPSLYSTSANTYGSSPNRIGVASTVLNGYLYAAGGCTSATNCTAASSTVSYAPIDVNGNLGTWTNTSASLPAARAWGKFKTAGGSLYYIGGQSNTSTDRRTEVYYATPSSGNVTSWSTASNSLPVGRTNFGATVWNNRLYVVGGEGTGTGCNGSNVCNNVYVSPQLNSGGNITSAWSTASTSVSVARSGGTVVGYANNLYLLGGYDGANYLSDTEFAQIDGSSGNSGAWTYSASLPGPLAQSDGFAANGYIYLIGGRSATNVCDSATIIAPISANTPISSGNLPTGVGEWYETNQKYTGSRYGGAAVYAGGKAYVLGGGCGATLTYASPVTQQTTLLSQPQVAKYSIAIDTDSDVFPTSWLLNGIDNAIGARWQLTYRSMATCASPAMTTWGQDTVFGDVTLGLPGVYIPKNAAGSDTNCGARYYNFNVSVDSSQAFGYPDDVTRGPTITDLTLQFSADPAKRLMHGRTFTGGLQQPVDTPYYLY
jgi:hypothetical protein